MTKERKAYLIGLADDFGLNQDIVFMAADMLGENEDYYGLVTTLEDYADSRDYYNCETSHD